MDSRVRIEGPATAGKQIVIPRVSLNQRNYSVKSLSRHFAPLTFFAGTAIGRN
jgi:hypothetical protein